MRLSYKNPNDSFQNIIDSDLTNSYEGWFHAGTVTSELINGSLKVDVDGAWEGVQHQLNNISVAPGDQLHVKLIFDKGNTQSNVRLYFQELDANGNHLSWNTLNGNLQTGTYSYPYTVNAASKLVLRIDKDNTNTGNLTSFYIDYVSVTTGELEIIEENNYYPFGLKHKGYNTNITSTNIALKRKFGGKEYQDELGLDWYDITARNYEPALGRWMNIDPLAEQMRRHSPYNYAFNNPIFFIDPDGLAPEASSTDELQELDSGDFEQVVNLGYGRTVKASQVSASVTSYSTHLTLNKSGKEKVTKNAEIFNNQLKSVYGDDLDRSLVANENTLTEMVDQVPILNKIYNNFEKSVNMIVRPPNITKEAVTFPDVSGNLGGDYANPKSFTSLTIAFYANAFNSIKGLAQTMFHEFIHVQDFINGVYHNTYRLHGGSLKYDNTNKDDKRAARIAYVFGEVRAYTKAHLYTGAPLDNSTDYPNMVEILNNLVKF